jgi:hypothetical protein
LASYADDNRWPSVINRAKNGDEEAPQAVDWKDTVEKHTVSARLMAEIGEGKRGKEIRDTFESTPYGRPRDAIDGALIVLHTIGHLRATHKGTGLKVGQLDQAKVSMTDFRVETATIDTKRRIRLRKLFHFAGIACEKPAWETLECLHNHGASLSETAALKSQAEAAENERRTRSSTASGTQGAIAEAHQSDLPHRGRPRCVMGREPETDRREAQ